MFYRLYKRDPEVDDKWSVDNGPDTQVTTWDGVQCLNWSNTNEDQYLDWLETWGTLHPQNRGDGKRWAVIQ